MTSPGSASAGNLHADIIPDVSGFTNRLKAELGKLNLPGIQIKAQPNLVGFAAELRRQVTAVPNPTIKVKAEPDLTGFAARLRTSVGVLANQQVTVTAKPVTTGFNAALRSALGALPTVEHTVRAVPTVAGFNVALRAALRALPVVDQRVNATPSTAGFNTALRTALAALPTQDGRVNITPRTTGFNTALRTALAALPTLSTQVRIDPRVTGFQSRLRTALAALPPVYADVSLSPDVTGFAARLRAAVNAMTPAPVVKVRVDPDLTGFRQRLRAAVAAMGTPPTIRVRIEPDLAGFGGSVASAARSGQLAGGAYAATFRAVIASALRNLPEPTIGAATGPAEQAVRDLRASLERLGNERVGVTITADQAMAEVRRIREDLIRLRAMSPVDVDVQANVRASELALQRMETQLHNIGRDRTANVRVRTDNSQLNGLQTALLGSTNRMQLLITAGLALGPAIVPAAAAAAAAIGAIGGAAISAGAGLGVGILALSGVVGAVKALNDAKNDAAKTNATLAKQDTQAASGADQVRSAIASLANTRAQAASQARQSAQAIADAERGLVDSHRDEAEAQRDVLRAQQDITRAREDAKDAIEDLDSAVKANTTSIKQARLDLADAEKELAKVAKLPVDNRARIEAEIAYERAKQNLDDLTIRQGRLAEEKKRSDKAGVEGSEQVVAAQEKIGAAQQRLQDAQRRVADAERSVSEARIAAADQARQSAFSIAQAQQAVVAAQRSVATSAVAAAATGGAAMDTLAEKMANLSPAAQSFARFISGLTPELVTLRQSAEQALPGFEQGIRSLLPALPALNDFVRRVAVSLGEMAAATGEGLNSAKLRPFFSYIDATAVPTLRQLGDAASNVGTGFANLIVGFGPAQRQFTGGLVDMTARFETWSSTLDRNNGFQRFLDYAITRGPVVLATLGDLSGSIIHLLEASAPAGDVVLTILSGIAHAIDAIPVPVLATFLGAMTALRIASLLTAIPIGALGASLATLPGRLVAMTTSFAAARAGLAAFASALGGPVTIAIAAATFGIGYLISQSAKQKAELDKVATSLESYGNALKNGMTAESLANAQAILRQDSALRGLVNAADQAGISQQSLVQGLNGDRESRQRVIDQLNAQIGALYGQSAAEQAAAGNATEGSKAARDRAKSLEDLRDAFAKTSGANAEAADVAQKLSNEDRKLADAIAAVRVANEQTTPSAEQLSSALTLVGNVAGDAAGKADIMALISHKVAASNLNAAEQADLFGRVLGGLGSAATTQGDTFDALAGTFNNIAESSINAEAKVQLLRRAMEQMYGAARAQTEANEALTLSKVNLTTQLQTNSAGFDLNSAKGSANTKAVLENRDALQAALLKAEEKYFQDLANGTAQDVARAAHERNKLEILNGIPPTQRSTAAVGDLVKTYGTLPDKKTTQVTTPGLDEAIIKVIEAHAIQQGVANGWNKERIAAEAKILRATILTGGYAGDPKAYKADGGPIEGWSPHKRADNVPIWATAGEFMQPVDTVDYYGVGFMEALRKRQIPRDAIAGYATGGLVKVPNEWPIRMPINVKMPKTIDQLWAEWEAAQASSGGGAEGIAGNASVGFPPWPRAHPGRGGPSGDSGVWRSIVALIRSTGPLSGSFGNGYRPGDPLWHGAGHAVDWMGYNQDALAAFLAARRPLELIHRTGSRDYAYTRGVNKGSFSQGLMEAHRNHIHIAMATGGLVPNVSVGVSPNLGPSLAQALGIPHLLRDQGGWIPPGLSIMDNRTGSYEGAFNAEQMRQLGLGGDGGDRKRGGDVHIDQFNAYANQSPGDIAHDLDWLMRHGG